MLDKLDRELKDTDDELKRLHSYAEVDVMVKL